MHLPPYHWFKYFGVFLILRLSLIPDKGAEFKQRKYWYETVGLFIN